MKNQELTNNDLELIFNRIIEQTPIIADKEVISLLNNPIKISNPFRHFLKTHLNILIVTAVVFCAIPVAIFLITGNNTKTEMSVTEKLVPEKELISAPKNVPVVQPTAKIDSANKKNSIVPSPINKTPEKVQSSPELLLADIFKQFGKKSQVFSVRPNRDTVLLCQEGTVLRIKANSFISEKTGEEITGKVKIAVKEYYKLSDMLMARLSTTSDGKIIETGGMIHISATSGNENCMLKQGEKIEIGFPYTKKKADMILFSGTWKNEQINWRPVEYYTPASPDEQVETAVYTSDEVFMVVEEMPEFPGGITSLKQYIQKNTQYPYSALKGKLEGTVYVNFVVDRSGYVRNISIARGLGNVLDKSAAWLVSQMPSWRPGKQRGQPVNISYTVPVTFRINETDTTAEGIRKSKLFEEQLKELKYDETSRKLTTVNKATEEFEKKLKEGKLQESDIFAANRYVLGAYQLGWINCDRFVNFTNPKTHFSILINEPRNAVISVIFQRMKAIMPGQIENDRISFKDIPLGEKITIVALKTVNNQILLVIKETEITENAEIKPDFQPITPDRLKTEMEKLNHMNLY